MAGVPVLASRIDGNVGVLGEGYPGYFPVGDSDALRDRLSELATDPTQLECLTTAVEALQPLGELPVRQPAGVADERIAIGGHRKR